MCFNFNLYNLITHICQLYFLKLTHYCNCFKNSYNYPIRAVKQSNTALIVVLATVHNMYCIILNRISHAPNVACRRVVHIGSGQYLACEYMVPYIMYITCSAKPNSSIYLLVK